MLAAWTGRTVLELTIIQRSNSASSYLTSPHLAYLAVVQFSFNNKLTDRSHRAAPTKPTILAIHHSLPPSSSHLVTHPPIHTPTCRPAYLSPIRLYLTCPDLTIPYLYGGDGPPTVHLSTVQYRTIPYNTLPCLLLLYLISQNLLPTCDVCEEQLLLSFPHIPPFRRSHPVNQSINQSISHHHQQLFQSHPPTDCHLDLFSPFPFLSPPSHLNSFSNPPTF